MPSNDNNNNYNTNGVNINSDGNYTYIRKFEKVLQDVPKYENVKELDGIQADPKSLKTINFKQDYVVMIRKKYYYAANVVSDELYLRVYQINNFTSVRTSHNTFGRPGTCSISIRGGERVICAEREEQDSKGWVDWKSLLKGWTSIDDEGFGGSEGDKNWRVGHSGWNLPGSENIDFKNLMKSREAKYGWKFAEKADWEPMDEIYVFAKSRNKNLRSKDGYYQFLPIFFGYIDSIQKTYQAGKGGLLINITASDHLKLLELGQVLNYPSIAPGKYASGLDLRFPTDEFGCFIINDPLVNAAQGESADLTPMFYYNNVFAGKYPYEIITQLAQDSGIPSQYLEKRIEKIKTVPFLPSLNNKNGDLLNADFKKRIDVCRSAAEKLFLEFFADEEGNIVLKIPSYAVGANKLPDNNMGYSFPDNITNDILDKMETNNTTSSSTSNVSSNNSSIDNNNTLVSDEVVHTVKRGETLTSIAKKYFGDTKLYLKIYNDNRAIIGKNPNLILPGQNLIIRGVSPQSSNNTNTNVTTNVNNEIQNQNNGIKYVSGIPLSQKTDNLIPEILSEYIVSFTLNDSDKEIYNMFEIQAETIDNIAQSGFATIRRVVPDLASIIRFGLRPHPGVVNTPLISSELEAQLFGILMINRSLANRYTGSLTMIEDSSIKVGDPIRFMMYDEHPMKPLKNFGNTKSHAIFYVTGIERNISPNNVSYMTLQLRAGRMMGQESIFDMSYIIYKFYYDEKMNVDITGTLNEFTQYYTVDKTEIYTVQSQDTIQKIINKKYGSNITGTKYEEIISAIMALNQDLFQGKTIARPEIINETLYGGLKLKIPKSNMLR